MAETSYAPRYGWRLAVLMADHKIRTNVELQRRLAEIGYKITSSQLSRIVYDRPAQVKTALLDALGEVFECTVEDIMPLLESEPAHVEQPASHRQTQPRLRHVARAPARSTL